MKSKKPFQSLTDLDSVTITCPCGIEISGEGEEIRKFIKQHKKHTNGKLQDRVTDNGMKAYSNNVRRDHIYTI